VGGKGDDTPEPILWFAYDVFFDACASEKVITLKQFPFFMEYSQSDGKDTRRSVYRLKTKKTRMFLENW
jgi:hypothetical protein